MKTKRQFKYFSILDHEKEEAYLSRMHAEGWRFVRVSGLGLYHFEECTPEQVVYQLDYNQEGLAHKEEYLQMFRDCGWEYLQDYVGYSYFRKPESEMKEKEGIFCDDQSRLQMFERVFKGRVLPLVLLFSAVLMPQFFLTVFSYHNPVLAAVYGGIILLYLTLFAVFAIRYWDYRKKAGK